MLPIHDFQANAVHELVDAAKEIQACHAHRLGLSGRDVRGRKTYKPSGQV
jgi:hypothetical protein